PLGFPPWHAALATRAPPIHRPVAIRRAITILVLMKSPPSLTRTTLIPRRPCHGHGYGGARRPREWGDLRVISRRTIRHAPRKQQGKLGGFWHRRRSDFGL